MSDFQSRFKDRISVVGKTGARTQVPATSTPAATSTASTASNARVAAGSRAAAAGNRGSTTSSGSVAVTKRPSASSKNGSNATGIKQSATGSSNRIDNAAGATNSKRTSMKNNHAHPVTREPDRTTAGARGHRPTNDNSRGSTSATSDDAELEAAIAAALSDDEGLGGAAEMDDQMRMADHDEEDEEADEEQDGGEDEIERGQHHGDVADDGADDAEAAEITEAEWREAAARLDAENEDGGNDDDDNDDDDGDDAAEVAAAQQDELDDDDADGDMVPAGEFDGLSLTARQAAEDAADAEYFSTMRQQEEESQQQQQQQQQQHGVIRQHAAIDMGYGEDEHDEPTAVGPSPSVASRAHSSPHHVRAPSKPSVRDLKNSLAQPLHIHSPPRQAQRSGEPTSPHADSSRQGGINKQQRPSPSIPSKFASAPSCNPLQPSVIPGPVGGNVSTNPAAAAFFGSNDTTAAAANAVSAASMHYPNMQMNAHHASYDPAAMAASAYAAATAAYNAAYPAAHTAPYPSMPYPPPPIDPSTMSHYQQYPPHDPSNAYAQAAAMYAQQMQQDPYAAYPYPPGAGYPNQSDPFPPPPDGSTSNASTARSSADRNKTRRTAATSRSTQQQSSSKPRTAHPPSTSPTRKPWKAGTVTGGAGARVRTAGNKGASSQKKARGGDYDDELQPQRRRAPERPRVEYKPHSLREYRELTLDLKLGGLGPDLENEERKAAEEKNARIRSMAMRIREENAARIQAQQSKPKPPQQPKPKEMSAAERAREFAKNVPKPKVRPSQHNDAADDDAIQYVPQRIAGSSAQTLVAKSKSPEHRHRSTTTIMDTTKDATSKGASKGKGNDADANADPDSQLQQLLAKQAFQRADVERMKRQMGL